MVLKSPPHKGVFPLLCHKAKGIKGATGNTMVDMESWKGKRVQS